MKNAMQDRASVLTSCYHESLRKRWPCVVASLQSLALLSGAYCYSVTNDRETKPCTVVWRPLLQCNKR